MRLNSAQAVPCMNPFSTVLPARASHSDSPLGSMGRSRKVSDAWAIAFLCPLQSVEFRLKTSQLRIGRSHVLAVGRQVRLRPRDGIAHADFVRPVIDGVVRIVSILGVDRLILR